MVVHAVLWDSELQICSLNWIRKPWFLTTAAQRLSGQQIGCPLELCIHVYGSKTTARVIISSNLVIRDILL